MKNRFIIFSLLIFLWVALTALSNAEEITFESNEIKILDNGNVVTAKDGVAVSIKDGIKIVAKDFIYNKRLSILDSKIAVAKSTKDNIEISANKIRYNNILSTIYASGDVVIKDLTRKITFKSQSAFYDTEDNTIEAEKKSEIRDKLGNIMFSENFIYTVADGLVKINNTKIIDAEKNVIQLEKAFVNVNSNKLIGKDVSIDFSESSFEKDNDPRLKGKTITSNGNQSIITNGVFTTCKKNDDCPPWQFSAKKITHDKKKKIIYYKDAWLKLYDKPVFYFPKFFHPDPTVKRQSGFLIPSFNTSNTLGGSFNLPYYHVIADNKDLTISPRFYSEEKLLVQSEFREINSKSNNIFDFSLLNEKNSSSKSHFFAKTFTELDFPNFAESSLSLNIEQTSDDKYLKSYKLKSPLITDAGSLRSSLGLEVSRDDLSITADLQVIEDLSKTKSDRYEFILPNYNLVKEFDDIENINGNFLMNSSGFIRNYDTNIFEKVVINDLIFDSNPKFTNSGLKNDFNFILKNVNVDSDNSERYKNKRDHNLASLIQFNSSYPLKKVGDNFDNIFKPLISFKYSPNKTRNMRNNDRRIDINNIFSFNRIGADDTLEGGASVTYGAEFSKINKLDREIIEAKIANVSRIDENEDLPTKSRLGEKTSDIVGNLTYSPNNFANLKYDYSIDSNLNNTNYQMLETEFKVNNFITSFEYLNENNTIGSQSFVSNKTSYLINDSSKLAFETRENKKTKLTEFYNLIYQYRNDCLIAAIEYNKDYYTDGDLKPEENIFFKLSIIPFGKATSPNLK